MGVISIVLSTFGAVVIGSLTALTVPFLLAEAPQLAPDPLPLECAVSPSGPEVARFAKFLTFETIGNRNTEDHIMEGHRDAFLGALAHLRDSFPNVYSKLQVEQVGLHNFTLLFTWPGSDPSLNPVLYISHYDVVPVTKGTEDDWTHPPFAGRIVDGVVWGRGALDVKYGVAGLLEACERLLKAGWQPTRTVLLSFGHDEEIGGFGGAAMVAELLAARGVRLDVVLDEGGSIFMDGLKTLLPSPVAVVGTAEKLYTSYEVHLKAAGGHSSVPPVHGEDIGGQMGRLLTQVAQHQPPAVLRSPMVEFLQALAPYQQSRVLRPLLQYADKWPLRELYARLFARAGGPENALVRTTVAATRIEAGVADNVLPNTGVVSFNTRSHPNVPRSEIMAYLQASLHAAGIEGADIQVSNASHHGPPGVVTPVDGKHFKLLKQALQELWRYGPENKALTVAPFMLTGGTDSKHYAGLTDNGILRFVPFQMNLTAGELGTVHSTNERVRAADFARAVCTYERVIQLLNGGEVPAVADADQGGAAGAAAAAA